VKEETEETNWRCMSVGIKDFLKIFDHSSLLATQATVLCTKLFISDSIGHIEPMQFTVQKSRQTNT